jgi:hypothetical protein
MNQFFIRIDLLAAKVLIEAYARLEFQLQIFSFTPYSFPMTKNLLPFIACLLVLASCQKESSPSTSNAKLIFKFQFDSTQTRLTNTGEVAALPTGNAGQSPVFNKMSAHYVELTPTKWTALGAGAVLYRATETTTGGSNAIDFEKAAMAGNKEVFYSVPIKDIAPGEYEWLRVSLAYQNFDVKYFVDTVINGITIKQIFPATVAGFIGFNTYIKNLTIKNQTVAVNANKKQGFWGAETEISIAGNKFPYATTGQAPEGSTTVVNPLFATSPIPQGSCVVTASFGSNKLKITGAETRDITILVSLSTNKSFEWKEVKADGLWEPGKNEAVVDMGIRGMITTIQ